MRHYITAALTDDAAGAAAAAADADNTTPGDDSIASDGSRGGDKDTTTVIEYAAANLTLLPRGTRRQFAGLRATVDLSAEVRQAMMHWGWREPTVNTTHPRHLYSQLMTEQERFVAARGGGDAQRGNRTVGHDDPCVAPLGPASAGVVYMALGTPRYIDRAALVASVLLHHTPGTNITLFTDRALWAQWRAMAEDSARSLIGKGEKRGLADTNLVGSWMRVQAGGLLRTTTRPTLNILLLLLLHASV